MGLQVFYFKKKPQNVYPGYYVVAAQDEECAIAAIHHLIKKPAEFHQIQVRQKHSGRVYYPTTEGSIDLKNGDVVGVFEGALVINIVQQGFGKWEDLIQQPEGYGADYDPNRGAPVGNLQELTGDTEYLQKHTDRRQELVIQTAETIRQLSNELQSLCTPLYDERIKKILAEVISTSNHILDRIAETDQVDQES